MILENTKRIGQYRHPDTGKVVTVETGRWVHSAKDVLFYMSKGVRHLISEHDFYYTWEQ